MLERDYFNKIELVQFVIVFFFVQISPMHPNFSYLFSTRSEEAQAGRKRSSTFCMFNLHGGVWKALIKILIWQLFYSIIFNAYKFLGVGGMASDLAHQKRDSETLRQLVNRLETENEELNLKVSSLTQALDEAERGAKITFNFDT